MVVASALLTCVRHRFLRSGDTSGSWGPERQHTPRKLRDTTARVGSMPVHGFAEPERKHLDPLKATRLSCPQRLVCLGAPEHVEFEGAVSDGRLDGERHQDEADAVCGVTVVVAVLIEVEATAVVESVHDRGDRVV